jgi:cell division topological specificity factor
MASFLDRVFGRNKQGSSSTAKDRLRFVLQYDRVNIPPEKMEAMKREILEVISKYVSVDSEKVDIALEQRDRDHSKIVAEIPFTDDGKLRIHAKADDDTQKVEDKDTTTTDED